MRACLQYSPQFCLAYRLRHCAHMSVHIGHVNPPSLSLSHQSLTGYLFSSFKMKSYEILPIPTDMPTEPDIMKIMFRQPYCYDFIGTKSMSYEEDTTSELMSWS